MRALGQVHVACGCVCARLTELVADMWGAVYSVGCGVWSMCCVLATRRADIAVILEHVIVACCVWCAVYLCCCGCLQ